jgi:hypothetical protein
MSQTDDSSAHESTPGERSPCFSNKKELQFTVKRVVHRLQRLLFSKLISTSPSAPNLTSVPSSPGICLCAASAAAAAAAAAVAAATVK